MISIYLATAALGYWVLERASSQKKNLKTTGQLVGALIIVLSFLCFGWKLYIYVRDKEAGFASKISSAPPSNPLPPTQSSQMMQKTQK
ncbi:MAG: hypothetical protein ABH845_01995 [Candidatus Omnitrophota bacterium]